MAKKPLADQYVEFMGRWLAGAAVGHALFKIGIYIVIVIGICQLICD